MKRKRLGKDLQIRWSIVNRDQPFMIEGLDITLYLKGPVTKTKIEDFTLIDNRICWVFLGKHQKHPGIYSLELVINEGKEGMTTTDACSFVELTDCSCKEGGISASNIEIESLDLTSVIEFNYDDSSIKKELAKKADKGDVPTKMSQLEQDVELGTDSPIVKGEVENSAVLEGEYEGYRNRAISQTAIAVGAGTIAGLKGWYYSKIDFTNKKITLSDRQVINTFGILSGGGWSSGTPNIQKGDIISLVNNTKFDFCSKVTNVSGNIITVDTLPFSSYVNGIYASLDDNSIYIPDRPDAGIIDFGGGAFAEGGLGSKASNICAHAEGLTTHAYGQYSHAEGRGTKAGYASHAEGRNSEAIGETSHAEGFETLASGDYSHAEGSKETIDGVVYRTIASGKYSHAEGRASESAGETSHAEGYRTIAKGKYSHTQGQTTYTGVDARAAHAEGIGGTYNDEQTGSFGIASHSEGVRTTAKAQAAHSEGQETIASGKYSHAEGNTTTALGAYSHAEGQNAIAEGDGAHAEGKGTHAIGNYSHAEGWNTIAEGTRAHAEGDQTNAKGSWSHVEGQFSTTTIDAAHAEGRSTKASGYASHAEGIGTRTNNHGEHAEGTYNQSNTNTIHSVGIGTSDTHRKNAHEITTDGKHYIYNIGGYDGTNPTTNNDLATYIKSLETRIKELEDIIEQITEKV